MQKGAVGATSRVRKGQSPQGRQLLVQSGWGVMRTFTFLFFGYFEGL